jgi:hypothetical protein
MSEPQPVVYISLPMTGYEEFNIAAARRAQRMARNEGYVAIIPHEGEDPTDEEITAMAVSPERLAMFLRKDVGIILDVDEVWVLPGWEYSEGCKFEVLIAQKLGIPVFTLDGNPLFSFVETGVR